MPKKPKSSKTKGRMKTGAMARSPTQNNKAIDELLKDASDAYTAWHEMSPEYKDANPFFVEKHATTGGVLALTRVTKVQSKGRSNVCLSVYINGQEMQAKCSEDSIEHVVAEKCRYWLAGSPKGPLLAVFISDSPSSRNIAQILCTFEESDIAEFVEAGFKRPVDIFAAGGKGGAADDIEFESESEHEEDDDKVDIDRI